VVPGLGLVSALALASGLASALAWVSGPVVVSQTGEGRQLLILRLRHSRTAARSSR
jgi:hypothetical protein